MMDAHYSALMDLPVSLNLITLPTRLDRPTVRPHHKHTNVK